MMPGIKARPPASIVFLLEDFMSLVSTIFPSWTARSPGTGAEPDPSSNKAFLKRRSNTAAQAYHRPQGGSNENNCVCLGHLFRHAGFRPGRIPAAAAESQPR